MSFRPRPVSLLPIEKTFSAIPRGCIVQAVPSPLAASDPGMMIRRRVNGIPGPSIYTSDRVIGYTEYVDTFVMLYLMRDVVHFIRQYMTSMTLNVFCVPPHERA